MCRVRWIWSTTVPAPGPDDDIEDWVLWRLWRRNLRPLREFADGDEVWIRHGRGRSATISWRARADSVLVEEYEDLDQVADRLEQVFGLEPAQFYADAYTADKSAEPGRVLAFAPTPVERRDVPFP